MQKSLTKKLLLIISGLTIGVANGFFGGGGGMLVVPALNKFCGLDEKKSHATAIFIMLPLCLISSIIYIVKGTFNVHIGVPSTFGIVLGGFAGAILLSKLQNGFLKLVFYAIMLFAGIKMVL